jgi:hypothetical protein
MKIDVQLFRINLLEDNLIVSSLSTNTIPHVGDFIRISDEEVFLVENREFHTDKNYIRIESANLSGKVI